MLQILKRLSTISAISISISISTLCAIIPAQADDSSSGKIYKGVIKGEGEYIPHPTPVPAYGLPKMVGIIPKRDNPDKAKLLKAKIEAERKKAELARKKAAELAKKKTVAKIPAPKMVPVPQVAARDVLPPQFLGRWQVQGGRDTVAALPQYQEAVGNIFAQSTQNTWNITGSPETGYMLSTDTGVATALTVHMDSQDTAILRYQHPIKNTYAQEAVVLKLLPGGAQFQGLENVSIVKPGEPQPRAKVKYRLTGAKI